MGRPKNSQPAYLEHKPSGQARVRIAGVDLYLGKHNSPESWQAYHSLLADLAAGRKPEGKGAQKKTASQGLTVAEFVERYNDWAATYYSKNELCRIKSAVRPLLLMYGLTLVEDFSPLKLQKTIERLCDDGDNREPVKTAGFRQLTRQTVNAYLVVLKRLFKWGVSQELVSNAVYQSLCTVNGIRRGRGELSSKTREAKKILPVSEDDIEIVLQNLNQPEIAAMIQVQLLCGMRPDEVTIMRPRDIDRTRKVWSYVPATHKQAWRDQEKEILIGPKAQKILADWLKDRKADEYLFSPRIAAARWNKAQRGNRKGSIKMAELRPPRQHYDDETYGRAVARACRRAEIDVWTPNRLRHNAATTIRAEFGVEDAGIVLGHKKANTAEIYAAKNRKRYEEVISKVG